jgi:SAM-dependent methyltransferase
MNDRSRADWNERSKAWAKAAPQGKSQDDSFNQMIIAEAGIKPGEDVLDIASGAGNPAISIALSMGGQGSVTCTDLTLGMLETARGRAANLDIPIMRFVGADMCALPFADNSFDVVTCRFGIMFPDDKIAAAAEVLRVLRPGGRVAYMAWGPYDENPPFFVPRRTVARFLNQPEGPEPGRHKMSAPGTLKAILDGAGFTTSEERKVGYENEVPDIDAYVTNGLTRSYAKETEGMDEAQRAALKDAVMEAWQPYLRDGITYVPNRAVMGLGWKAA